MDLIQRFVTCYICFQNNQSFQIMTLNPSERLNAIDFILNNNLRQVKKIYSTENGQCKKFVLADLNIFNRRFLCVVKNLLQLFHILLTMLPR